MNFIDTDAVSESLREKGVIIDKQQLLITNFSNSLQEQDLTEPANCNGYGRIRHFKLGEGKGWPINPLPIYPAAKALNLDYTDGIRAQVFQNAICNWRCWYCFVDFKLLAGNRKFSNFLTCKEMVDLYMDQDNPPLVIDLTGGQPDLIPEWVPWMMEELTVRGLSKKVYLWSDDNLSNDYFWRYLTPMQIKMVSEYKMYGRVCCFKGIDETSFAHNTKAHPSLFNLQFEIWERLLKTGIDLYSYVTLPAPTSTDFYTAINRFLDKIQSVDENYPLRIVPLKIYDFTPSKARVRELETELKLGQEMAIDVWRTALAERFPQSLLDKKIVDIKTIYQND